MAESLRVIWHRGVVGVMRHLAGFVALLALLEVLAAAIPIGYIRFYFSVRRDDEIWHEMFQRIFKFYLWAAGVTLEVEGIENLPPDYRPVIVAANHQSMLDGPIMDLATGARRGVALTAPADYFPWPMSFWVRKVGSIQVARSEEELKKYGRRGALEGRVAVNRAVEALHRRHVSLLIFPEGHTEHAHHSLPFQTGAIRIALGSGAPVVPATIHNSHGVLQIKHLMLKSGTIRITFQKQFPLPRDRAYLNDHALVKLWTNQLLCHIASELPANYFSPGMALACKEVLSLNPLMRTAVRERIENSQRKSAATKKRVRTTTKKKGASR